MKFDHSTALESIAAASGQSPLSVLEFFLERSAIREHHGSMPRGAAEEWAVEDCRAYFAMRASVPGEAAGLPSDESNRLPSSAPRDSQMQPSSAGRRAGVSR